MTAKQVQKTVRLKRDIIIPAGTILKPAPLRTSRSDGHFEHLIAIGKDNTATLTVFLQRDAETAEWLEPCRPKLKTTQPCGASIRRKPDEQA